MSIFKSKMGKEIVHQRYKEILALWPVNNDQYMVNTQYGKTFVIESGKRGNPPLLLIHGSVSSSYCWIGDVKRLSETHNVYAVDIIGEAGYSDESRPSYESGAYAKWLEEVIKGLGLSQVSIVGLSLGGWMALSYATQYPKNVDQLILLCPGGISPERKSFIPKAIVYSLLGKWGSRQITKMINGGTLPDVKDSGMTQALEYTALIGKHFNPRMGPLYIFPDKDLNRLTMPILVLFGEKDCIMNGQRSIERIEKHGHKVRSMLLKDTGHVVAGQTERIIQFLGEEEVKSLKS